METPLQRALHALRDGQAVLLYDDDGREGETDLVVASEHATPDMVRLLRRDGGGLLCTAIAPEHHQKLGLPYAADLLAGAAADSPILGHMQANDLRYDRSKSSFGITLNSRRTFTGIPDGDRSLTIRELAAFLADVEGADAGDARLAFGTRFRTPGHVILLNGHPEGLAARQGHTELSLHLARLAGLVPCATVCEMLDPASGRALGKKEAQAYAHAKGLVFLTGQDVLDAWLTSPTRHATVAATPSATAPPVAPATVA